MSTGISISSINRIKELAEKKKFKEALEILDTQNLDKSINPQFLKISGEIFRENKRYYDCRRILLKAHQMAPEGNRILYELIRLYLELGYFTLAKKYYEQYMFNVTPEDTQKDYLEYMMKKADGADSKELAAILIPILERLPEDSWNFEAVLLYHKMDRKDLALDEARYILENFKESEYVKPVIDYIDDKLDVDQCFYVYPKEEQPEDEEMFGDLIALEEKLLEADHLRMFPPEAKIMVEAEDNDAIPVIPVKEKKKKIFGRKSKESEQNDSVEENASEEKHSEVDDKPIADVPKSNDQSLTKKEPDKSGSETEGSQHMDERKEISSVGEAQQVDISEEDAEQRLKVDLQNSRELALEKLLAKKIDTDKIKESAKQMAKAVKDIDTDKAKQQMKSVAETVKDNMKKATDAFGEVVGTKQATDSLESDATEVVASGEEIILDGIIESVLEPPKKAVGQVVMNEELDALIPDSLEAMSEKEIAEIEAKREEIERLELEALEANLKREEERKAKLQSIFRSESQETAISDENIEDDSNVDGEESVVVTTSDNLSIEEIDKAVEADRKTETDTQAEVEAETLARKESMEAVGADETQSSISEGSSYSELKNRFIEGLEEIKPLDSLGFITVVHSDVDATMEDEVPDAAGMLRQMIDNKEFYEGDSSLGFESKASYENHGFEIEDYDFDEYIQMQETAIASANDETGVTESNTQPSVQDIFAQESVVAFEEVLPEEAESEEAPMVIAEEPQLAEPKEEPMVIAEEPQLAEPEEAPMVIAEEPQLAELKEEPMVITEEPQLAELEEELMVVAEESWLAEPKEEPMVITEEPWLAEPEEEPMVVAEEEVRLKDEVFADIEGHEETTLYENDFISVEEPKETTLYVEESISTQSETIVHIRKQLRENIVLTYQMESLLRRLKESR